VLTLNAEKGLRDTRRVTRTSGGVKEKGPR